MVIRNLDINDMKEKVPNREMNKFKQKRSCKVTDDGGIMSLASVHESLRAHITAGDLRNISQKKFLTGNVIAVIQQFIKAQYHVPYGLQDPLCGIRLQFVVCKEKPFVQVLHDGNYHWVTVSTYNCKPGEVIYMDSLFTGKIKQDVKRQICSLIRHDKEKLTIKVIPVQQQNGSVDCGLFALAFAQYVALHKEYPSLVTFNQFRMRHHVLRALAANKLDPFPTMPEQAKINTEKIFTIDLYCTCRLPWFPSDGAKVSR